MHKLKDNEIKDIENGKAILVDVRTVDEYNSGHAAYAFNAPLDEISSADLDKNKRLYLYCASGGRSQMAAMLLSQKGYDVVNIGGLFEAIDAIGEA
jgi:phage shock protein E